MKQSFSGICISINGCESNLTILNQSWTIEYDPNRGIIIIKDSNGNTVRTINVKDEGMDNYSFNIEGKHLRIYVKDNCLHIDEKNSIPSSQN
jgi:hypothetical protein